MLKKIETEPFIQGTLFYLNIIGLNPKNQTIFAKLRAAFTITLGTVIYFAIILDTLLRWNGAETFWERRETCLNIAEVVLTVTFLIGYLPRLNKLLDHIQQFWALESKREEVQREVKSVYSFVGKSRKFIKICYWISNVMNYTCPFFNEPKRLPVNITQPFDFLVTPRYEIVYFLQYLNSVLVLTLNLSFDLLFITYVTHGVCELKMLKHEFANFKVNPSTSEDEKDLAQFGQLVEHHDFVLRFIKELRNLYSTLLLIKLFSSMFSICMALLSLSYQDFPIEPTLAVAYTLYLVYCAGELFIFCVGSDAISRESAAIADAVYQSEWWVKTQPKLRKAAIIVMSRAQKPEKIAVRGMLELDLECFAFVVSYSFSFYTCMRAMYIIEGEVASGYYKDNKAYS